MLRCNSWRSR
jgi:hypothetical protein